MAARSITRAVPHASWRARGDTLFSRGCWDVLHVLISVTYHMDSWLHEACPTVVCAGHCQHMCADQASGLQASSLICGVSGSDGGTAGPDVWLSAPPCGRMHVHVLAEGERLN